MYYSFKASSLKTKRSLLKYHQPLPPPLPNQYYFIQCLNKNKKININEQQLKQQSRKKLFRLERDFAPNLVILHGLVTSY